MKILYGEQINWVRERDIKGVLSSLVQGCLKLSEYRFILKFFWDFILDQSNWVVSTCTVQGWWVWWWPGVHAWRAGQPVLASAPSCQIQSLSTGILARCWRIHCQCRLPAPADISGINPSEQKKYLSSII